MTTVAIVPAFNAATSIAQVVKELRQCWTGCRAPLIVVDDGSSDETATLAEAAGALVLRHPRNAGKGAALLTGLRHAERLGARCAVTLDADGQHPPREALRLALHPAPGDALVLGVRDLRGAGAPRANRFSNGFSNVFVSLFSDRVLSDTQCGLRRYPVRQTLALDCKSPSYAFEAEVIIRAAKAGLELYQVPVQVIYPPGQERVSHFKVSRDPPRIVARVVHTFITAKRR